MWQKCYKKFIFFSAFKSFEDAMDKYMWAFDYFFLETFQI